MRVVETKADLRAARAALDGVGFVPTMGFLHAGHRSLIRLAQSQCSAVVVSIFVNPKQFGATADLTTYPRDLPRDLALLEEAGVDLVFAPTPEEIYPSEFSTSIDVGSISRPLEGSARPGHFEGVATVVAKLFNLVEPQRAFFGRKDAQQVKVIQRMTSDLDIPVEIVIGETVREADGLALSSRNTRLDARQRREAVVIYAALQEALRSYVEGNRDADLLRSLIRNRLMAETSSAIDYVSVADPTTLAEVDLAFDDVLVSTAVWFGSVRLIDNVTLPSSGAHLGV